MIPWTEQVANQGSEDPAFREKFKKILKEFKTKKISEKKFSEQLINALEQSVKRTKINSKKAP